MEITKCANFERDFDLDKHAHTSCHGCNKNFCFGNCFSEYHLKNNLKEGHRALSISNPSWVVNVRSY